VELGEDLPKPYPKWEPVAGYFDGDGSVSIFVGKFTIAFYLDWTDQSAAQLSQILSFFRIQGIKTGKVRKMTSSEASAFRIADQGSVVYIAEHLLPYCYKKREELLTLLEYRKYDLITGSEVQRRFQKLVRLGLRERHGNRQYRPIPWAYSVGSHLSRKGRALTTMKKWPTLSKAQREVATVRHNVFGMSIRALSKLYGTSRSAVWRALKNDSR